MFLDAYEKTVAQHHNKVAFICGQNRITYAELDHQAQCITSSLINDGLTSGDRVVLRLHSLSNFAASCIGIWRAGGIVVPLDSGLVDPELSDLLKIAQPSIILSDKSDTSVNPNIRSVQIDQLLSQPINQPNLLIKENDNLLILFSSGTTGIPKGIVHTHASLSEVAKRSVLVSGLNSDDILLATSIFNTGFGLHAYVLEPLICAATVVIAHPFHPRVSLEIACQESVSWIQTVPAVLKLLLSVERTPHLPALRTIRLGAATLDPLSRTQCKEKFGINPIQGYGMGEIGRIACTTDSPGKAINQMTVNTGINLKIFGENQAPLRADEVGEIGVQASSLCRPYYLVGNGTKEPIPMHNGYFMTGDLGEVNIDGRLQLMGRIKTFILTPRFKVDPGEVEKVLLQHPAITEAAVLPAPGKSGYEIVKAVVVTKTPLTTSEVMLYCSEHLVQGKCPQIIKFVDHLPRNKLGKVEISKLKGNL